MIRKMLFGFLPVMLMICCNVWAQPPQVKNCCGLEENPKEKPKNPYSVCPLYMYADYGTYRSWYAQKCDDKSYVSLDTTATKPGDCKTKNDPNCTDFPGVKKIGKGNQKHHSHKDLRKKGIKKRLQSQIRFPQRPN